ncbi:MAG: Exodeoxyribonuclease 7 large subunit [Parcubacteria group bacterium Gr01-1014_48]|nr:MAG: Exodeoxyribonuclease 7 large subunit [Parcubacteria group bacterium Greene0416_14]TSC74010.1 MAG: Exodeoxyribonuclease 7 large subunit [Parcubacteria group bacterium Gr01-1014_48]TSD00788.1 MAG: Exodeoxyribonuclease 7 large subunit [Parcubacteria group bacterium Greene1014_15]TSD07333.1 MAG: Exodeoxyribonuclease 7 large subunit [Parcubacteria group bacterium Greene0714_4]
METHTTTLKPYSVGEYIELLNENLAHLHGEVIGEVSEYKLAASGHAYFTLKDKENGHILPCTLWRRDYELCGVQLEVGMEVLVRGKPNFYGPFGKLSFIAKTAELVGEGALKKAYEVLRKKLEKEGLFAAARKRAIPKFPRKIGVVTSVRGAVIHDFSNNLRKSGFKVKILDTRVEGPESGRDLTLSVRAMRKEDIDVLVLIRGGGSMQSLAGYDNEALVREIVRFPVPVIAGVGHHQDVPLAALVADAAESTPSLCAALLNRSWIDAEHVVDQAQRSIFTTYSSVVVDAKREFVSLFAVAGNVLRGILKKYTEAEQTVFRACVRISAELAHSRDRIKNGQALFLRAYGQALETFLRQLENIERIIVNSNPERQLRLGYSLAMTGGKIVRSVKEAHRGDILNVKIADGEIVSIIKEIT